MAKDIRGKVALITGASSGIGAALAQELGQRGAHVVLTARRMDRIESLAQEISIQGAEAIAVQCDVTQDGDLERTVTQAHERFGHLDLVICNAGISISGLIEKLTLEDHRKQLETNVFGVLRTISATLEDLKQSKGYLGLLGSVSGYLSVPGFGAYSISKAAIRALSETLVNELSPYGISVTHIAPGFIESEIRRVDNQGRFISSRRDPIPPWLIMPAKTAAKKIVNAMLARKAELVLTGHGKVGVSLARHTPKLVSMALKASASKIGEKF